LISLNIHPEVDFKPEIIIIIIIIIIIPGSRIVAVQFSNNKQTQELIRQIYYATTLGNCTDKDQPRCVIFVNK